MSKNLHGKFCHNMKYYLGLKSDIPTQIPALFSNLSGQKYAEIYFTALVPFLLLNRNGIIYKSIC